MREEEQQSTFNPGPSAGGMILPAPQGPFGKEWSHFWCQSLAGRWFGVGIWRQRAGMPSPSLDAQDDPKELSGPRREMCHRFVQTHKCPWEVSATHSSLPILQMKKPCVA